MKLPLTLIFILIASFAAFAQSEKDWSGYYQYLERMPPRGPQFSFAHYVSIDVLPDKTLKVMLTGIGHYYERRTNCSAKISGNRIMIYYDGSSERKNYYSHNGQHDDYLKDGDLLLTLERRKIKRKVVILTYWEKFHPNLGTPLPGKVSFRKI
jgi:hypothetical protein